MEVIGKVALNTGEVVSWGYYKPLTIIPDKSLLKNIKMVYTAGFAFAALSYDGQVCAWGDNFYGYTDNDTTDQLLQNVKHILPAHNSRDSREGF